MVGLDDFLFFSYPVGGAGFGDVASCQCSCGGGGHLVAPLIMMIKWWLSGFLNDYCPETTLASALCLIDNIPVFMGYDSHLRGA